MHLHNPLFKISLEQRIIIRLYSSNETKHNNVGLIYKRLSYLNFDKIKICFRLKHFFIAVFSLITNSFSIPHRIRDLNMPEEYQKRFYNRNDRPDIADMRLWRMPPKPMR